MSPVAFGDLLRYYRRRAGLSQETLAEQAGISARAVSDLERGLYRAPHRDTVRLLMGALNLSPADRATMEGAVTRTRGPQSTGAVPPPLPDDQVAGSVTTGTSPTGTAAPPNPAFHQALPIPLTSLLGRSEEIATITRLLCRAEVRIVTLTGPGGVGKTRLALEVAANLRPVFADGVIFVPLAQLREPDLVLTRLAQAVGLSETSDVSVHEHLARLLRNQHVLVVLDNCEHLTTAAPQLVDLLRDCPEPKLLVTSQAALRVRGEHQIPVPPLALPDPHIAEMSPPRSSLQLEDLAQTPAVALFVQRTQALKPDFELTMENAAAVAAICRRLDGLPLAIELAAARSRIFSPGALLARLDQRLVMLVGGAQDLPPRQQTLRATLEWSYSLLTPDEQVVFHRLGAFEGGCPLTAAETVLGLARTPDTLTDDSSHAAIPVPTLWDILASLVDKSLVRMEDQGEETSRFVLLETIGTYACELLAASGEEDTIRRQHAGHFLALAEEAAPQLIGASQEMWLARLEKDHANLLAALRWARERKELEMGLRLAGALGRFWDMRGYLSEGRRWLEEFATAARADPHGQEDTVLALRARVLNAVGNLSVSQGQFDHANAWFLESLALRRAMGDDIGIAAVLNNLGIVAFEQGDNRRAAALNEECLVIHRALGNKYGIAASLNNLGDLACTEGDYRRATILHEECLALRRAMGDTAGISTSLQNLGDVALATRNTAKATALYQESLGLARMISNQPQMAICLEGLAKISSLVANPYRAALLYGAATTLRETIGAPVPPSESGHRTRDIMSIRQTLGDETFSHAWAEGQTLPLDTVCAVASTISVPVIDEA